MLERKKGPLSKLYPLTKLVFLFCAIVLAVVFDWRFGYLVMVPLTLFLAIFSGNFFGFIKKFVGALLLFVIFVFLFKIMLDKSDSQILFQWQFIVIRIQGLIDGLNQTSVLVVMAAVVLLFFETTEVEDLMISLQQKKVSHVVSYIVLSTLQMIPDMVKRSKVIMQAQQARGIETEGNIYLRMRAFFPSLGPLIISSISELEERAITLEVRGFSASVEKTFLKDIQSSNIDRILSVIFILISIVCLRWRIVLWLS
jgi:energy-coupling factor transport system permease protein